MELGIYSIKDEEAQVFSPPFSARTDAEAIRAFAGSVQDPKSVHARYPENFQLFKVGTFDDEECTFKHTGSFMVSGKTILDSMPQKKIDNKD